MTINRGIDEIDALKIENLHLREEVHALKERLSFLEGHQTLAAGMRGETLISRLLSGTLTSHTEAFDVELQDGVRLEVKSSHLNRAVEGSGTQRWAWGRVLGANGGKRFDFLVLVGVADERYRSQYLDPKSPYVLFLVPRADVEQLATRNGVALGIQLTTNPAGRRSAAGVLFEKYQVTIAQLRERFGL